MIWIYTKFFYCSPKNIKDARYLIGARSVSERENKLRIESVYLGVAYTLEEFLARREILNIKASAELIVSEYEKSKKDKIIYFPHLKKFGFFKAEDKVVASVEELFNYIDNFYQEENSLKREKSI